MNAYSAAYTAPNGDKILYFALEKNKDNGTNNAAFWFLQDGSVNCSSTGGAVDFAGNHREGDILVTSAFSSGVMSSILVFRWAGGANGCIDSLNNPIKSAGGCNQLLIGSEAIARPPRAFRLPSGRRDLCDDQLGATGHEHQHHSPVAHRGRHARRRQHGRAAGLPRGAIDLTKAFANAPGGGTAPSCFNTFIADTRSSTAATATLFDYARGQLGQCRTTSTTDADIASPASIDDGSISSGTDTATLTITGTPTWGGTLTWWLCGPIPSGLCNKAEGVQVTENREQQLAGGGLRLRNRNTDVGRALLLDGPFRAESGVKGRRCRG